MNKLIVFEGNDGCGKSTLINQINKKLIYDNLNTYISYDPGNMFGMLAKYGHPYINKNDTLYLWWLSRKLEQNKSEFINADIILKDRYYYTTFIYLQLENDLYNHNFDNVYFRKPDITFIIDLDIDTLLSRLSIRNNEKDHFETKDIQTLKNRRNQYLEFEKNDECIILDGNLSITELSNITYNHIKGLFYDQI